MSKLKYLSGATQVLKWSVLYPIDNENSRLRKILYFIWAFFFVASFAITDIQCIMNIMPIPGWFPYDHTKSPQYELSYIWQIFCQINLGLIYGASDMIYPCMTIVIGQQFKILASNLRNNFYKAVLKSKNNVNYLKKNIEHHQVLLKYCDDLNTIMSPFLMTKVMAVSLVTIFTVFTLITSADRTMIFGLCSYVFFGSAELFIYNYSGQVLIESGDALWTLYKCPWYLCDLKFQKLLLMVQMRISEMTFTKAGNYFTMSAETFIGVEK
ncbi:7tm 6 domain containing protein, partial [Asbolus verrucosus]